MYREVVPVLYYLFFRCLTPSSHIPGLVELDLFKRKLNQGFKDFT